MTGYRTIVADPPWNIRRGPPFFCRDGNRSRPLPYSTMSLDEIRALPVRELAAPAAHLYLWTVNAYLEHAFAVARTWGFTPSTTLVWAKKPRPGGLGEGMEGHHRVRHLRKAWHAARDRLAQLDLVWLAPWRALAEARGVPGHG